MIEKGNNGIEHNGHSATLGVATEGNPYTIRRRPERLEEEADAGAKQGQRGLEAEEGGVLGETEPKTVGKKRFAFIGFLSLVIVSVAAFAYMKLGGETKIDHQVKANRSGGITQQAQQLQGETSDQQTEAAIAQAKEARRAGEEANAAGTGGAVSRPDSPIEAPPPTLPRLSIPGEYVAPRGGQIPSGEVGGVGVSQTGSDQPDAGRGRNRTAGQPQHGTSSVYISSGEEPKAPAASSLPATAGGFNSKLSLTRKEKTVTLPAFGTMLPVRTLGAVYTLRNSLARLELTREVSGDGWVLKKGTVLIAQQQGGVLDRAYASITGFIDSATNRFVKMTGEVLGSDGAPGLKGKKRQISGRWSRAFNRILNVAPGIAQAALARNGGTTVIVPTGSVTSDLIGTGNTGFDRREFVEVEAGAPGYVMITDLPDTTKGVDADPEKYLAESDQGSLSDGELAKLLSEGTPQQIKAAMPRMTPEMRRVAAVAIGEPEK